MARPKNIGEGKYGVRITFKNGRQCENHWMPTSTSRDGLLKVFQNQSDVSSAVRIGK